MLDKTLHGLKQAPRAWYDRLSGFLLGHGYSRGQIDNTLFFKRRGPKVLIVQVYVDDIIFGGTDDNMGTEFLQLMGSEFEMSIMGEINFFIGLQIRHFYPSTEVH